MINLPEDASLIRLVLILARIHSEVICFFTFSNPGKSIIRGILTMIRAGEGISEP